MNQHVKRLKYQCKCINISIPYASGSIVWVDSDSEFEVVGDITAQFGWYRTWADNIDPERLREARLKLKQKADSFVLGMRFLGNRRFSQADEALAYVTANGDEYQINNDMDIEGIIRRSKGEDFNWVSADLPAMRCHASGSISPVPLPQKMPSVTLILKRHILNIVQAEELDVNSEHYEDEQLKRWFLIIEELEVQKNVQTYKDLRSARNFVSHPTSNAEETIIFLKRELPSSVYVNSCGQEEARYIRDDPTHRAFVSKYETVARRWAKGLVENEILSKGGYTRP
jgi:hypothetical protein